MYIINVYSNTVPVSLCYLNIVLYKIRFIDEDNNWKYLGLIALIWQVIVSTS